MSVRWPIDPSTVDEFSVALGYDPDLVDDLRVSVRTGRIDVIGRAPESGVRVRYVHWIIEPDDDDPGSS